MNVLNLQLNMTPSGQCPITIVTFKQVNSTSLLNGSFTALVRNCNGKVSYPSVGGKLQYGKTYTYVTKAFGYDTAIGKFVYNSNPQFVNINMNKKK
jgi:hypothetical protein